MEEMKYLTELAVRDYYFSTQRTSTIALAAIFNVIEDMTTGATGLKDLLLLRSLLSVITESFDFDHPKQVAAAIKRLRLLAELPERNDVVERSEDDSVKSRKVGRDASGNVRKESRRSSLSDADFSCWSDQDLHNNHSCHW